MTAELVLDAPEEIVDPGEDLGRPAGVAMVLARAPEVRGEALDVAALLGDVVIVGLQVAEHEAQPRERLGIGDGKSVLLQVRPDLGERFAAAGDLLGVQAAIGCLGTGRKFASGK